jgi:hypothetical protein
VAGAGASDSDSDGGLKHTGSDGVGVGVDAPATPHWNGCERQRPVGEIQLGGERLPQHHTRLAPRQSSWSYVAGIAAHNDGGGGAQNLHTTATVVVCAPRLGRATACTAARKGLCTIDGTTQRARVASAGGAGRGGADEQC